MHMNPGSADPSGRSLAGIVGSYSAWGRDVCLLWVLCFIGFMSLRRNYHSSRGVLPSVVCPVSAIVKTKYFSVNIYDDMERLGYHMWRK